jgi:hypothetical protein
MIEFRQLCALALSMLMLGGLNAPASAASLTSALQRAIRASTFEVVMKKPEKDSVTYGKPVPLELPPYIERTDSLVRPHSAAPTALCSRSITF